jgi:uncharacterized membrane protein
MKYIISSLIMISLLIIGFYIYHSVDKKFSDENMLMFILKIVFAFVLFIVYVLIGKWVADIFHIDISD